MTLMLVHPDPGGNPAPRPHRGRSPALFLSVDERQHLGACLRGLRRAFGTWGVLAKALGVRETLLIDSASPKGRKGSLALAVRASKVAGIPVEHMLAGTLLEAGCCPTCGSRVGDRPVLATGGSR
jgi:hypothetical protein